MLPTKNSSLKLYNPGAVDPSELIGNFVVRLKEYEMIWNVIQSDDMKDALQHFLIVGLRGQGKTTLLHRVYYQILKEPKFKNWLIPIMFPEEQYQITKLSKLWMAIASYLEENSSAFSGIRDSMESLGNPNTFEEECYRLLKKSLESNRKKIVLFIDNFGDMLDKFSEKEQRRLREVLITNYDIRIVAASSKVLEHTYDHSKPLFEFFKMITMKELSHDETINLLLHLDNGNQTNSISEILESNPGKIEALRRVTGGIPRTIVLLYTIFKDDSDGSSFTDLEQILDAVTPLYKHRMDDLPTQQQEIVEVIALKWDAISVKEISKTTRMESKLISAQLQQLEKNRIVEKQETSKKNHLYRLTERFFNVWYLMRFGNKKDINRVRWYVQFLELWCNRNELKNKADQFLNMLKSKSVNESYVAFVGHSLAEVVKDSREQLLLASKSYLAEKGSLLADLIPDAEKECFSSATQLVNQGKYEGAIEKLLSFSGSHQNIDFWVGLIYYEFLSNKINAKEYFLKAIQNNHVKAMYNLAHLYRFEFKDFGKAEEYYLKAVQNNLVKAMFSLAHLYETEFKSYDKAEEYYLKAVKNENIDAMFGLALLYETEFKNFEKAEEYYLKAVQNNHINAMFNLALLYETEFKNFEKAKEYYLKAAQNNHVDAMYNLGLLYDNEFKNIEKAEEFYLMAVKNNHVGAMFNLALLYENEFNNFEKAKEYYLKAVQNNNVEAMSNLALMYKNKYKNFEKAEEYYLMAVQNNDVIAMNNLAVLYRTDHKIYGNDQKTNLKLSILKYLKTATQDPKAITALLFLDEVDSALELIVKNKVYLGSMF